MITASFITVKPVTGIRKNDTGIFFTCFLYRFNGRFYYLSSNMFVFSSPEENSGD